MFMLQLFIILGFFFSVSSSQETLLFSECLLTNIPFVCDVTLRAWISSRRFERTWRLRLQGYKVMSRHTIVLDWTAVTMSELASLFLHILTQQKSEDRFYFFASGLLFKLARHTALLHAAVSWLL